MTLMYLLPLTLIFLNKSYKGAKIILLFILLLLVTNRIAFTIEIGTKTNNNG